MAAAAQRAPLPRNLALLTEHCPTCAEPLAMLPAPLPVPEATELPPDQGWLLWNECRTSQLAA